MRGSSDHFSCELRPGMVAHTLRTTDLYSLFEEYVAAPLKDKVNHVIGLLKSQSRLVGVDPILTIVVAPRLALPKLLVDNASHDLAFNQVVGVGAVDQAVASALLPILLLKASTWLAGLLDSHDIERSGLALVFLFLLPAESSGRGGLVRGWMRIPIDLALSSLSGLCAFICKFKELGGAPNLLSG